MLEIDQSRNNRHAFLEIDNAGPAGRQANIEYAIKRELSSKAITPEEFQERISKQKRHNLDFKF